MSLAPRRSIAILGLATALAAGGALGEVVTDEDGYTHFEDVDTGETHSLDEVDTSHTETLDSVATGHTETLDSVDTGHTESLGSVDTGEMHGLDSEIHAPTVALEAAEQDTGVWEAPPCGEVVLDLGSMPPGSDSDAWSQKLARAQQREQAARARLQLADDAYTNAKTHERYTGNVVRTRDTARHEYSMARCTLPALLRRARRDGVLAEVTRPYI